MLGCKVGCLSALGAWPLRSFTLGALFPLLLSKPEREDEEFLLVAEDEDDELEEDEEDEDEDEEAAAEPPCRFALVVFLAALGEAPGVAGMDLSKLSCTSMSSKLSLLSVLVDFFMEVPPELLGRGRGWGLVFVTCAVEEGDGPATCLAFLICSRRSGKADPLGLRLFVPLALELLLLFVELSLRFGTSFRTSFVVR